MLSHRPFRCAFPASRPVEYMKVPTAPGDVSNLVRPPASLRHSFAWTLAGNVVYGGSQWVLLSLIAKLGDSEMLGRYALAVALTTPVAMLSHLNLRAVLATDVERRHLFGDYVAARWSTTAASLVIIALIALLYGRAGAASLGVLILLVGFSLSLENISDIYYGALQRRERMDVIAKSMIGRGLLTALMLGAALWLTGDLLVAVAALALVRVVVLAVYDVRAGSSGEDRSSTGWRAQRAILWTALPLGAVLMFVSLTANVPRYAIERYLGTRELGAFAAVAAFIAAGNTLVNALGQSATPRLARYFSAPDVREFRKLALRLTALAVIAGVAGVAGAALLGKPILRIAYRPEYVELHGLLVALMAAGTFGYVAITLGYLITSARSFAVQMPLLACVAAVCAIASWRLVPAMGLFGAALALGLAGGVQIAGAVLLLRRALRQQERPA